MSDESENKEEVNSKEEPQPKKKRINWKSILRIIKMVLIVIVLIAVYLLGKNGLNLFKSKATVINSQFEDKSQLITQVQRVTVMEDTKKDRSFFELFTIPFTQSRILFSYDVIIEAGIDFSQIKYVSEDPSNKTLTLSIPHSEIFNQPTVDYSSRQVYLDQDNLFSNINFEETESAVQQLVGKAKEKAIESGELFKNADENAKRLIEQIVKTNPNYKDFTIIYQYKGD